MAIVHHHLIYQAHVGRDGLTERAEQVLEKFLYDLVMELDMKVLIPPQLKYSHQRVWSGLVGIVTSHASFHYWTVEQYVQLDIYSCKKFDKKTVTNFFNDFWNASHVGTVFINRKVGKDFQIESN